MFRTLIYPSSGACDCVVELPHRSSYSQFVVCWRFGVAGFEWCPCCRLKLTDYCLCLTHVAGRNTPLLYIMVWLYDGMMVWWYYGIIVWWYDWLHDGMMIWLYGGVIIMVWLYDGIMLWLYYGMMVLLYDGIIVWLYFSMIVCGYDCLIVWWYDALSIRGSVQLPSSGQLKPTLNNSQNWDRKPLKRD